MSDKPEDRPEERRRTGPLGGEAGSEETQREGPGEPEAEPTRQVPAQQSGQTEEAPSRETERVPQRPSDETEDKETRVIRTPPGYGTAQEDSGPYPRGYFEATEERENRLRDMYGGVDWLASFLGFVITVVVGALFSLMAGLVLAPLGFSVNLGGEIGAAIITGLVLVGVLIFLTYFFGGYVAGRLARFDGGRNGAMLLLWTLAVALLAALAGGIFSNFLPDRKPLAARDLGHTGRHRRAPCCAPRRLPRWAPRQSVPRRDRPHVMRPADGSKITVRNHGDGGIC
jgi:hypothetical protein